MSNRSGRVVRVNFRLRVRETDGASYGRALEAPTIWPRKVETTPVPDLETNVRWCEKSTERFDVGEHDPRGGEWGDSALALFLDRSEGQEHEWHRRPPRVRPRGRTCLLLSMCSNRIVTTPSEELGNATWVPHLLVRRPAHSRPWSDVIGQELESSLRSVSDFLRAMRPRGS